MGVVPLSPASPALTLRPEEDPVAGLVAVGLSVVLCQAKRQKCHPWGHAARDAWSRSALSWWHSPARFGTAWHGVPMLRGPHRGSLTSAWPPGVSVLLQRSQRRQGRCQSFPSEVTFSAAAGTSRDGHPHTSPTRRGRPERPTRTSPPCIQTPDPLPRPHTPQGACGDHAPPGARSQPYQSRPSCRSVGTCWAPR